MPYTSRDQRPLEPTRDFVGGMSLEPAIGRLQLSRTPGSGRELAMEIQSLLRQRLKNLAIVCVIGFTVFMPCLFFVHRIEGLIPVLWLDPFFNGFFLVSLAAVVWILCSKRAISLWWLRSIDSLCAALLMVYFGWGQYDFLLDDSALRRHAEQGTTGMLTVAALPTLTWVGFMTGYGVFIPNTWRRSVVMVGVMASMPLAISTAALTHESIELRLQLVHLSYMATWISVGAAIAVYGSHRISVLRTEAFEARKLGQYQLKERLGGGGMGEVYRAEHRLLRRPCAIKLIRPERAGSVSALRRFEREVQATASLAHWNIIEVFDYGHTADGNFYYVMEYLPGLSLQELVERYGPLPPARAIHLLRQVSAALRAAHAFRLIHRDIKPSNVMVCERSGASDVAKLLDFGLVQAIDVGADAEKLTQEGHVAGTPAFMSPEQVQGQDLLDATSDIYSLGAVAYYLLSGQPPFTRATAVETMVAHLRDPVSPLADVRPDVPDDLGAIVLRCLEKDPSRRFPSAEVLEKALCECAGSCAWTEEMAAAWWQGHRQHESARRQAGQELQT